MRVEQDISLSSAAGNLIMFVRGSFPLSSTSGRRVSNYYMYFITSFLTVNQNKCGSSTNAKLYN